MNWLELDTGDLTYPTVRAFIKADGYRKGIVPGRGPWRDITYQVFDDPPFGEPGYIGNAGRRSDLFMDALMAMNKPTMPPSVGIFYYFGHRYPLNERLICTSVQARHAGVGRPADNSLHDTNYVEIDAHYEVPEAIYDSSDDPNGYGTLPGGPYPFFTVEIRRGSKSYSIPLSSVHADGDDTKRLTRRFEVQVPLVTYILRYVNVRGLGEDVTNSLINKINNATIFGKAPGTLKFDAPESNLQVNWAGERQSNWEAQLTWFPPGWNYEIFDGDSTFTKVVFNSGGVLTTPYEEADFTPLLTIVPP